MLSASFSFFLRLYTLTKWELGALCEKEEVCVPPFFWFCFEFGHWGYPTEKSTSISFLRGTGWGK